MGEYADMEIDRIMDWGVEDFDDGYDGDDMFIHRGGRRAPRPHCRLCGETCGWLETADGWRLANGYKLHRCDEKIKTEFLMDEIEAL